MDPIAQTFRIENTNGGCMITSIDVYFKTKSTVHPIILELVNLEGGIPVATEVIADKVLYPSNVAISNDASLPTKFTFDSPVFIDDNDYAFVLKTNSKDYLVWVATLGQTAIDSPTAIWKQAAEGQMLTSHNKQSWEAVVDSDIKYVIRKAQFNTSVTGNVIFRNRSPQVKSRSGDLIQTTNGSASLKIYIQHHGMTANVSKVRLEFDKTTENYSGILASALNGNTYLVTGTGWNWITITAATNATTSKIHYTSGIAASYNAPMDRILVNGFVQSPIGTSYQAKIKTTSGRSIDGTQTPYIKDAGWTNIDLKTIHKFKNPRIVASYPNELLNMTDTNSLEVGVDITSENPNLSPIVHLDKFGAAATGRVLNNDLTSEISPRGGKALARYVTKAIQLQNPATSLKIMLAANTSAENTISVYYKIKSPKASSNIDNEPWVQLNPTAALIPSTNYDEFFDYTYDVDKLTQFTSFKVKVVFSGTNSALSPRIKDFRFIALAV
jgi:hypothetical protein